MKGKLLYYFFLKRKKGACKGIVNAGSKQEIAIETTVLVTVAGEGVSSSCAHFLVLLGFSWHLS